MPESGRQAQVHVDFNDMDPQGRFFVLPGDTDGELTQGSEITLYDAEGNSANGSVVELLAGGRAMVAMVAGSWHQPDTVQEQVLNLVKPYLSRVLSLNDRFHLSGVFTSTVPETATPSAGPRPDGAVLSSL